MGRKPKARISKVIIAFKGINIPIDFNSLDKSLKENKNILDQIKQKKQISNSDENIISIDDSINNYVSKTSESNNLLENIQIKNRSENQNATSINESTEPNTTNFFDSSIFSDEYNNEYFMNSCSDSFELGDDFSYNMN